MGDVSGVRAIGSREAKEVTRIADGSMAGVPSPPGGVAGEASVSGPIHVGREYQTSALLVDGERRHGQLSGQTSQSGSVHGSSPSAMRSIASSMASAKSLGS